MKTEALQELGLTEDQIKEVFKLNGKDVETERKKAEKAETERDQWKERAEAAENTLKSFDGVDVEGLKSQIADWKDKAEKAEQTFKDQLYERDFADALKAELDEVKFSSEAAKRSVMADIKEAGLKLSEGKILGLGDLLKQIREKDASAFVDESGKPPAKFTEPKKGAAGGTHKSLSDYTLDERIKLKQNDPQMYEQLKKGI